MNIFQWEILASSVFFLIFCIGLWRTEYISPQGRLRASIKLWVTGVALFALASFTLARLDIANIAEGKLSAIILSMASLLAVWFAFAHLLREKLNPIPLILYSIGAAALEIFIDSTPGISSQRQIVISIYRGLILIHLSIWLSNEKGGDGKMRHRLLCVILLLGGTFLGVRALYFLQNIFHFGISLLSSDLDSIFRSSTYVIMLIPILGFVLVFVDKHLAELSLESARAAKLHNLYEITRQCNQAIVRYHNRKELLKKIAQICVEHASVDLVWVGSAGADGWLTYEAVAGQASGYVDGLKISINDNVPEGRGGTGKALREKKAIIYNEYGLFDPWHDRRNKFGIRSGATLPFFDHKHRISCITFYSTESYFFTEERIVLLTGLAEDLGNALSAIQIRFLRAEALRQVRANKKLLNFALDSASDATWQWSIDTGAIALIRKSQKLHETFGEDLPDNIDGWETMVLPADLVMLQKKRSMYLAGDIPEHRTEFRMRGKDDRVHWMRDTGIVLDRDINGQPLRMVGTMKVIDAEIRQKEALAESENRFRLLAENAADLISRHDITGAFLYTSPSFFRILGYQDEELAGKSLQFFVHADDLTYVLSSLRELKINQGEIRIEYRMRKKDGEMLWVESSVKTIMDEAQATILELQMATREIGERKSAEQSLREHDQFLISVISSQINGIIVTDAGGTITFANDSAEKILDMKFRTLAGKTLTDEKLGMWLDFEGNRVNPLVSLLNRAIGKRESIPEIEQGMRLVSGKIKWLAISASPLYSTQNLLTGAVISFIDISERVSARKIMLDQMRQLSLQHDAINSSNNGIVIADALAEEKPIIYANKRFEFFSGIAHNATTGISLYHLRYDKIVHGPAKNLQEVIDKRIDQTFIVKSSKEDGGDLYFSFSLSAIVTENGQLTHFVAVLTDISERMETRKELEELTERLQLAISGANIGIVDIDLINKQTHMSEKLVLKLGLDSYTPAFSVNELINIIHPEDQIKISDLAKRHFRNEISNMTGEIRLLQHKNKWVWFSVRGKIMLHPATGKRRRFSGVLTDISERKEHELRIQELTGTVMTIAEKERAEISSELHDTVGQGLILAQLNLQNHLRATDQRSEHTEAKLLQPIKQVLKITREISRRISPIHMRDVGIRAAVEEMILSATAIANLKARLDLEALEGFFTDDWDINCYRVIQEALTNTIKHANATIFSVIAEQEDRLLIIDISDNGTGTGIAKEAKGIGTLIMQERIRILNGSLMAQKDQFGFNIHIEIPNAV